MFVPKYLTLKIIQTLPIHHQLQNPLIHENNELLFLTLIRILSQNQKIKIRTINLY